MAAAADNDVVRLLVEPLFEATTDVMEKLRLRVQSELVHERVRVENVSSEGEFEGVGDVGEI